MSTCVFCDATTNLNNQMTIDIDGRKATVNICDTHAEDATLKTAKAAYLVKQQQAETLIAQLNALGYKVEKMNEKGGLIIPTLAQPTTQIAQKPQQPAQPAQAIIDENMMSSEVFEQKSAKILNAAQAAMSGDHVMRSSGYSPSMLQGLTEDQRQQVQDASKGQVKVGVFEGRGQQPIVIPEKKVDGFGTTVISIVNTETDHKLQNRFKKMAEQSSRGEIPDFARSGYSNAQKACPICHGTCSIVNAGKTGTCPKCKGSGTISVY